MYYEVYQGLIYDNLIQAESETGVPLSVINRSYYNDEVVKYIGKKYKFVDLIDKIQYAE